MIWHWVFQTSLNKLMFALICITQQGILNIFSLQANHKKSRKIFKKVL